MQSSCVHPSELLQLHRVITPPLPALDRRVLGPIDRVADPRLELPPNAEGLPCAAAQRLSSRNNSH